MIIAIFQDERVYEGKLNILNAVYPMPTLSKVVVDSALSEELKILGNPHPANPPLFREDSFDPTSRLRRGRFYNPGGRRSFDPRWVNHYPYSQPIGGAPQSYEMDTYDSSQTSGSIEGATRPLIILGDGGHKTGWRAIASERLFNGETLFTLKSANSLGILPELKSHAVPIEKRPIIELGHEKVADAVNKYLPEPIVDVCREFARLILAAWLPTIGGKSSGDLGDLANAVPHEYPIIKSSATIINRLHPRGKSSERERQAEKGIELREVSYEDGELSVSLVACLLREVRWAT